MTIKAKLRVVSGAVFLLILLMTGITYVQVNSYMNDFLDRAGMDSIVKTADSFKERMEKVDTAFSGFVAVFEHEFDEHEADGTGADEDIEKLAKVFFERNAKNGMVDIHLSYHDEKKIINASGWVPPSDFDARQRPWYLAAVKVPKGVPVFSTPYTDVRTKQTLITVSQALYDRHGKMFGVLASDVDISDLFNFVVNSKIMQQGHGALVLQDGLLAAHSNPDYALKANLLTGSEFNDSIKAFARRMLEGETGVADYTVNGEERRVFFTPIGHGYYIFVYFPVAVLTGMIRSLTSLLVIVAALAFLIIGTLLFAVIRGISRSINNMRTTTDLHGAGNLAARYDASGKDELAAISQSLNTMLESVGGVLIKIQLESETTSHQAETLAALSQETLASMEEVAASLERVQGVMGDASDALEETNVSIGEIASGAQTNADASTEGAEQASQVNVATGHAVEEMGAVVRGMQDAEGKSRETMGKIQELSESVSAISSFVNVIPSIADQTNLLALNAAIEAARAGEAGRGFAVVAEEVRKLAEESAKAASEVNNLIDGLERHSADSLEATDQTVTILHDVVSKAETANHGLQDAMSAMVRLNEAIQNIAAVSEEQAASSAEMESAMKDVTASNVEVMSSAKAIYTSTQETTKAAESIATEAQKMAETAETLQKLVGIFNLDDSKALANR